MNNAEWAAKDLRVLWHPCTQMKDHETLPMIPIKRGQGVWLEDYDGRRYLDAISSWWVNILGHSHPKINSAICRQAENLEHVMLAGFTHEPAITLSERLLELAPSGLARVFYADNGSSAVEIAMKMSYHYWFNTGNTEKTRFISLKNSYHGETLGALSVGDVALYKETYAPLLLDTLQAQSPDCYQREVGESWADCSARAFADMRRLLEQHAQQTCAVIIEPLVQCAGNMRMYDPVYLKLLRKACDEFDVHLIADEIAVGMGRTGTLFACEQAGISPDFLLIGKGLTGGYLPLSACLTHEHIYNAFYDDYSSLKAFLHSHSYTGNALACAAAVATLDILDKENIIERNKQLAYSMGKATESLCMHPHIAEVRQTGMILAIEMIKDKAKREDYPWQERRGLQVYRYGLEHEALLRPLGNVVYFMPPYVINEEEIEMLARVAEEGIDLATKD
ncbi:MAG: adenosylmethionine--8-amino-7-oxononanoate transaminase [Gammaproteobacteria bacterium]|nr:MAG: adenosylmethionine--8-amino-7-oxononanoate transaminase [Gammaproteobacteria bacterium]